jgi:hypothetical protein
MYSFSEPPSLFQLHTPLLYTVQLLTLHSGNSTIAQTLNAPPPLTLAQKWKNLPNTTKIAIYAGAGGGAAILFAAALFTCLRARRRGRQERDAYNAKVEREREEAYQDQIQLREKGMGGWDTKEVASQGDDALGGWGGRPMDTRNSKLVGDGMSPVHAASPILPGPAALPSPVSGSINPFDTRANSPAPSRNMTMTPGSQTRGMNNMTPGSQTRGMNNMTPGSQQQRSMTPSAQSQRTMTPGPQRNMTPGPQRSMTPGTPNLIAPQPQRAWNGAPSVQGPGPMNPGITSSYGSSRGSPMSPNFPLASPQGRTYGPGSGGYSGGNGGNGGGYGNARGGYQRF